MVSGNKKELFSQEEAERITYQFGSQLIADLKMLRGEYVSSVAHYYHYCSNNDRDQLNSVCNQLGIYRIKSGNESEETINYFKIKSGKEFVETIDWNLFGAMHYHMHISNSNLEMLKKVLDLDILIKGLKENNQQVILANLKVLKPSDNDIQANSLCARIIRSIGAAIMSTIVLGILVYVPVSLLGAGIGGIMATFALSFVLGAVVGFLESTVGGLKQSSYKTIVTRNFYRERASKSTGIFAVVAVNMKKNAGNELINSVNDLLPEINCFLPQPACDYIAMIELAIAEYHQSKWFFSPASMASRQFIHSFNTNKKSWEDPVFANKTLSNYINANPETTLAKFLRPIAEKASSIEEYSQLADKYLSGAKDIFAPAIR